MTGGEGKKPQPDIFSHIAEERKHHPEVVIEESTEKKEGNNEKTGRSGGNREHGTFESERRSHWRNLVRRNLGLQREGVRKS